MRTPTRQPGPTTILLTGEEPSGPNPRTKSLTVIFSLLIALRFASSASAQKPERWIEARSPHFIVISNGGEKQARRTAAQFERFRMVFQAVQTQVKVDSGRPFVIFAVKDEKSIKALLPERWEKKGMMKPAGWFQPGRERDYAVVRLDAQGEFAFGVVYHEYTHMLTGLNLRVVPLWVSEGLAEFFAHAELGERESSIGRPSEDQLRLLAQSTLLPLDVLFSITRDSPHYNEENKSSIFYAQSWAMTHYFMVGNRTANFPMLKQYLSRLQRNLPEAQARQEAFGDSKKLEKELESYIRQKRFYAATLPVPASIDEKQFAVRDMPPPEWLAARGDFYASTGRTAEAKAALEEALSLDGKLAAAFESLGFLALATEHREDALKQFTRAVALGSKSHLVHYYCAMLAINAGPDAGVPAGVEAHLRKALELNPEFVPALKGLSSILSAGGQNLDEALRLAQKAAQLEPGSLENHISVAQVLIQMERADEAISLAQQIVAAAREPHEQVRAANLLQDAQQMKESVNRRKQYELERPRREQADRERTRASEQSWNQQEEETRHQMAAISSVATRTPSKKALQTLIKSGGRSSIQGTITQVVCPSGRTMVLALDTGDGILAFHAGNYERIDSAFGHSDPCSQLKGVKARVHFTRTIGGDYYGETQAIVTLK